MDKNLHILPYSRLFFVLVGLLCLTAITVGASKVDFGALNIWVALLIASTKASLVLLFFMHMKYEGPVIKYSFLVTAFSLAVVIGFIFWDVAFR